MKHKIFTLYKERWYTAEESVRHSATWLSREMSCQVKHILLDCPAVRDVRLKYFTAPSLKDIFESVDNQIIIEQPWPESSQPISNSLFGTYCSLNRDDRRSQKEAWMSSRNVTVLDAVHSLKIHWPQRRIWGRKQWNAISITCEWNNVWHMYI